MTYSRRTVVASAVSLPVLGLAGCNSDESSPGGSGSGGSGGGSGDGGATDEPTDTPEEGAVPDDLSLVADTRAVFDQVEWFATEYNTTLYQYRSEVEDVEAMVADARDRPALGESDVEQIRSRTSAFYDHLRDEMAPHFNRTSDIVSNTDHYISEVDRFRRRDDDAALDEELAGLRRYYEGLALDSFVQERFSVRPIRRPLYAYLRAEELDSASPAFVVGHPERPFVSTCRLESSWEFDLLAGTDLSTGETRDYLDRLDLLFGGLDVPTGRTGRIFVESHTRDGPRRLRPIYVQRYADEGAAEDALATVLEDATDEGTTEEFGRPTFHRIFYRESVRMKFLDEGFAVYDVEGDAVYGPDGAVVPDRSRRDIFDKDRIQREEEPGRNVYAYLARVGRHLVAASPSTLAWEQRPTDAEDAIRNTWLWT